MKSRNPKNKLAVELGFNSEKVGEVKEKGLGGGEQAGENTTEKLMMGDDSTDVKVPEIKLTDSLKVEGAVEEPMPDQMKMNRGLFLVGGLVAFLIIVLSAGFFLYQLRVKEAVEESKVAELLVEATVTPVVAEKKLVRSEWTFEVLNGTKTAGLAKKAAGKLTTLGYEVIKVGNAEEADYEKVSLFVSDEMGEKSELLVADLKEEFDLMSEVGRLTDSTASARLVVGE
jgi:hypothetical protein